MDSRRTAKDMMEPTPERPSIPAIWDRLGRVEKTLAKLDDAITNHVYSRLDDIERRLDRFDGALSLIRWVVPVLVGASIGLIVRFL